jgi:microcystin degradation protein MlrC
MRRVLTGDLNHETNTFSRRPTGIPEFESYLVVTGPEILTRFRDVNHEQAGFIDCAGRYGWELVPTVVASANPGGTVTAEAFERYAGLILDTARTGGPWDGVALSLHGAMVADAIEDGEGELLRRLRDIIGPDAPVAVTLDLHANVTPEMAALANILVSYKTYPHIDMRETAVHAGRLLEEAMGGRTVARTIVRQPPQLEGLDGGRTDAGPMVGLLDEVHRLEAEEGIHAVSLNAGFALADIACVGPSVTVTFDAAAQARANEIADRLAAAIWASRDTVTNRYLTPEEAADLARGFDGEGKPLVIADYADNPGAGAYGDATALLAALLEAGVTNACFGAICDPEAASLLHAAGKGATVTLAVGGRNEPEMGGGPLALTGTVAGVFDGRFVCEGPMYAGLAKTFGPTAVLHVDGIDVLVVTHNMQILDRMAFAAFGIDPAAKRVVALKSMQHFRAAFEPLAAEIVVCDSGAIARPRRAGLPFRNVRRPVYPLDAVGYP